MSLARLAAHTLLAIIALAGTAMAGVTRHDVLVIANSNSPTSLAVANYYAGKRNIPASHVRTVNCGVVDSISSADFIALRDQVEAHLTSLGSVAGSPATDPISTIVLCTGIPLKVAEGEVYSAVDSAFSGCFSSSPWGREPLGIYGDYQPAPGFPNPFYWANASAMSFDKFRANAALSTTWEAFPSPGFTTVRMLDQNTALAAGGGGVLFRGTRSGGAWIWSPVRGRDKAFVGWRVSCISVLDSAHAYACTGNQSKPHGGGTILATSDGGLTWRRLRNSARGSMWKLTDALMGIDFADTSHGWAVGTSQVYLGPVKPLLLTTGNGGLTWQDLSSKLPASFTPRAVSAADATNVWICGASGGIYHSSDGGNTWALANAGAPTADYTCIWVKSSGGAFKGWASGDGGKIVRTEDGSSWAIEASGLTTSDISDLAVYDQDHACAAYGATSFLSFTRGSGWSVAPASLAPIVSAAGPADDDWLAVSGTRYIFANSGSGWTAALSCADTAWRLRYMVTRLDGYTEDANGDGIPDDVKAIIDRACSTASSGRFVLDEATVLDSGPINPSQFKAARDALVPIIGLPQVKWDVSATYLTHETNVMGYTSWGMHDAYANNYTAFGRPLNSWANGGIGVVKESTDGRTFASPSYAWALYASGTIYAGKLTVTGLPNTSPYNGFMVKLLSSSGALLASAAIASGTAQIDLSTVSWPTDHNAYVQLCFPANDPLHPGGPVGGARAPGGGATADVYNNRTAGYSLILSLARNLLAEMLHEGASGGVANVDEPWSNYIADPAQLFPAYAQGFTFAESAYMSIPGIGWQEVAIGDPMMAPYATLPTVSITAPATDGQILTGTVRFSATATPAASIGKVEFWLDDDTLLTTDTTAPYYVDLNTTTLADGLHRVEAIAFENDAVENCRGATRAIISNNNGAMRPTVTGLAALADGTTVGVQGKTVSAAFDGVFYVEDQGHIRGMRVRSAVQVHEGNTVTLIGKLQTTIDREREILADGVYVTAP